MPDEFKPCDEAPIIRIAFAIIQQAIKDGASEILLEPAERVAFTSQAEPPESVSEYVRAFAGDHDIETGPGLKISAKVADVWHEVMPLPDYVREPLTERFKLMADMDLTRSDITQAGRIPIRYHDRDYVLLAETTPTPLGEQVLMRFEMP